MKSTAERNKSMVNKESTQNMQDLFKRILVYACGVLLTLSLLLTTAIVFHHKHDAMREGLRFYVQCELGNALDPSSNYACKALRARNYETISPFWFMSWVLSCLVAVIAQIVLSFHNKARQRAEKIGSVLRQKTMEVVGTPIVAMSTRKLPKIQAHSSKSGQDPPITPIILGHLPSHDSMSTMKYKRTLSSHITSTASTAPSTGSAGSPMARISVDVHDLRTPSTADPDQVDKMDTLKMEVIAEDR